MSKDIYGEFYNPTRILSTGKPYLVSIGVRSAGKSTGFLIHLLKEWMFRGRQFIYIRRTKDELDETAPNAFNNAVSIFNKYYGKKGKGKIKSIDYRSHTYYINDKIAGYAIPLSLQNKFKSLPFEQVWWMFYDEALISKQGGRYLGGANNPFMEAEALMSLFVTVDRGIGQAFRNELTCIIVGNNEVYTSPIFMRLDIDKMLKRETKFLNPKNKPWAVEQTFEVGALSEAKKSNAYALSSDYNRAYAFDGGIFSSEFLGEPSGKKHPIYNITYEGFKMGVYYCNDDNLIYVSNKPAVGKQFIDYALTMEDHTPNYNLAKEWRNNTMLRLLRDAYVNGSVRFANARCRYCVDTFFAFV